MSTWTQDELRQIDDADELQIAALRRDGTLRGRRPIWVVRVGDNLYVRAAYGKASGWHQVASDTGHARISVAGVNKDVAVERADQTLFGQIDAAYRSKYGTRYPTIVESITDPEHRTTTLRLVPEAAR